MSIWDSVKKFTRPYGEDEYDDYDDGLDGYEEEAPVRSRETESINFNAEPAPAASTTRSSGFSGQALNMNSYKQEVVLSHPLRLRSGWQGQQDRSVHLPVLPPQHECDRGSGNHSGRS